MSDVAAVLFSVNGGSDPKVKDRGVAIMKKMCKTTDFLKSYLS